MISEKQTHKLNFYFKHILDYFDLTKLIVIEDGREIRMPCPIHGGDNPTGFSWDKKYQRWRCWTKGCHERYGIDAKSFIDGMLDGSPDPITTEEIMHLIFNEYEDTDMDYSYNVQDTRKIEFEEFKDLNISERLCGLHAMRWGISKGTIDRYLVGIYPTITQYRVLFPIFDSKGTIVGATGRAIRYDKNNKRFPKWKHYNFRKSGLFYNIHAFKPNKNTAIIVEGPADVLKLESANIHNSLALLGSDMSNEQRIALDEIGIKNIYLCLDNDKAGWKGTEKIGVMLENHGYEVSVLTFDKKYNDAASVPLFLLKRKEFNLEGFQQWLSKWEKTKKTL